MCDTTIKTQVIEDIHKFDKDRIINRWNLFLESINSPFALYASVDWFQALYSIDPENYLLGVSETENGKIKSIFPIQTKDKEIIFSIARKELFKFKFFSAWVLGGEPLGQLPLKDYHPLFQTLFSQRKNIQAVYFKCLQNSNPFFPALNDLKKNFIHYIERKPETFTYITLGKSFDEYLAKFNSKARYNLKRQWRMALKKSGDTLRLERISNVSQMDFFIKSGKYVLDNSWKTGLSESHTTFSDENCRIYRAAAKNGLLRSYVLMDDENPWAFVLGFQGQGIFHYSNIAYSNTHSKLSPGIVLFYKMMEDLFLYKKPETLNFGIGDSPYKRRFGSDSLISSDHILFRKNLKNMCIVSFLNLSNAIKTLIKRLIK